MVFASIMVVIPDLKRKTPTIKICNVADAGEGAVEPFTAIDGRNIPLLSSHLWDILKRRDIHYFRIKQVFSRKGKTRNMSMKRSPALSDLIISEKFMMKADLSRRYVYVK